MKTFADIIKKSVLQDLNASNMTTTTVVITLGITCILALYLFVVYYIATKKSFYSKSFNIAIALIAVITASILLAMQSNLVISLGMVGALSIVRFRTAIKDPMDLTFLFWSISVGIICGAGLSQVAVILSLLITAGIIALDRLPIAKAPMILVVNADNIDAEDAVVEKVREFAKHFSVKSRNMTKESLDLIIELRVEKCSELVKSVSGVEGVNSVSLLSHDGEVTF